MSEHFFAFNDEEGLNLRKFIKELIKSWKLLVISVLIGGIFAAAVYVFIKPSYTATSVVSISTDSISSQTLPLYLIQNDEIRSRVAEKVGVADDMLPEMDYSIDKNDKTTLFISATSKKSSLAVKTANSWATEAVAWFTESVEKSKVEADKARTALDEANSSLTTYLANNNLSSLTWVEMVAITGAGDSSNIAIMESSRPLPNLTLKQRTDLTKLIRDKNIAQWYYTEVSQSALLATNSSVQKFMVLKKSVSATENFVLGGILLIPVGILLGFFVAVVVVLIRDWWLSTPTGNKIA